MNGVGGEKEWKRGQKKSFLFKMGFSLAYNLSSRVGWLTSEPQGSIYSLCLTGSGITSI